MSYTHYRKLLNIKNFYKIRYYILITINNKLSVRELDKRIKSKEYERLSVDARNKIINKDNLNIKELVPEPIVIKGNDIDKENITEKALHKLIVENISDFMEQLGNGYSFIKSEYPIKIGNYYNYIDLLLFNYIYNCFVVIELKITTLKSEHIGQVEKYVNYIDKNIKTINQNKTIGIILVKKNNKFIVEYSTNENIIARSYEIV